MDYYLAACSFEQKCRELQGHIAQEWREAGEIDGIKGLYPEFRHSPDYMAGYEPALEGYVKRVESFGPGALCACGMVQAQDCRCPF
jgi:hypothetical protein